MGVFREEGDRRFALTPLGERLRSDAPEPVGDWAAFICRSYVWEAWGHLLHSVRAGEPAFPHVHGTAAWGYRAGHPEEQALFDAAMTGNARRLAAAVLAEAGTPGRLPGIPARPSARVAMSEGRRRRGAP